MLSPQTHPVPREEKDWVVPQCHPLPCQHCPVHGHNENIERKGKKEKKKKKEEELEQPPCLLWALHQWCSTSGG